MTDKAQFDADEWEHISAPPGVGLMVRSAPEVWRVSRGRRSQSNH